ncbi:unnamed protein product [Acanthoscelides obtectus]|uniref:Uncharacterized protein n=1 Tax=Acanthoscelides obtectus TaxID=200917 RepID=A0A9P0KLT2_ACAOB|nr:unnamed protein product [Acanthoscelides obtectus]CAK1682062.1 hypothetical protein AOBTE_LOCUS33405 [Acanthoscelides obtectus]
MSFFEHSRMRKQISATDIRECECNYSVFVLAPIVYGSLVRPNAFRLYLKLKPKTPK